MAGLTECQELILSMSLVIPGADRGPPEHKTAPEYLFSMAQPLTTAAKYGPLRRFGILICCSIEPLAMSW